MPEPIVRWVGGKGRLLTELTSRVPERFAVYHEPFIGGGALFFALRLRFAYLADANGELVNLYRVIKREPKRLMAAMAAMTVSEAEYYRIRDLDRSEAFLSAQDVDRAARFVYVNKTCFNGLHRVNRRGQINAAYGHRRNPTLFDASNVMAVHRALEGARLAHAGFEDVLRLAGHGDFVYFDPPYDGTFTGYTKGEFDRDDQRRLWEVCVKLHRIGAKWMLSNSDTPYIRNLYRAFRIETVQAPRMIAARAASRAPVTEVIVRNY